MSFPPWPSDVDCGQASPLSGFTKHFSQDRSLQQDRFSSEQLGEGSSKRGFRSRTNIGLKDNEYAQRFFQEASHAQDVYNFDQFGNELEAIRPNVQSGGSWVAEFSKRHDSSQKNFVRSGNWTREYAKFDQPLTSLNDLRPDEVTAFEKAFRNVNKDVNWETEFNAQEKSWESEFNTQEGSWESEFNAQEKQENINSEIGTSKDELSKNAGKIIELVANETNPKFKNSMFMSFMRKLRDHEVHIEGNKVVEQKSPVSKVDWAREFETQHKDNWASEFKGHQVNAASDWSQEFITDHNSERSFDIYDNQVNHTSSQNFEPTPTANIKNWKDWASEFQQSLSEDTAAKDLENLINGTADSSWGEEFDKDWNEYQPYSMGYKTSYNYKFRLNNPYLSRSKSLHEITVPNQEIQDSILALEATVQLDSNNAGSWHQLGIKQQENEQDSQAIAALRRSVELNPNILDAWISLAVSYTNEYLHDDAYNSLESWLDNHTKYKHVLENNRTNRLTSDRHKYLSDVLMQVARSNPGENLDPDVQIALGILYNISGEYSKAVDCFQSALYKRPNDHLLWNKLGATLANVGKPNDALNAYSKALSINPYFVRAHFNIACALINMDRNLEAAQHLLVALSLQTDKNDYVQDTNSISSMSSNIWKTLKNCCENMDRQDLVLKCEIRDLDSFKSEFDL
ncbi:1018_t:CDS:2 [Acaulospora morrowiae]|uniref:1018_t:CDS:1 n=1 Tax=Acaulospora morrowiae TaxID=94023 RepID=A0A9N9C2U3_9GLOM|nr:1018_t:CDS:2 [Acaulospora morrowiae]